MTRADIEQKAIERFPIPYDNPRNHTQVTINAVAFEKQQAYIEGALMVMEAQWISVDDLSVDPYEN